MLTITTSPKSIHDQVSDVLIIPLFQDTKLPDGFTPGVVSELAALMKRALFAGQWGRAEVCIAPSDVSASLIAFVGLGDASSSLEKQFEGLRRGVALALVESRSHVARSVTVFLSHPEYAAPATEALLFSNYWFAQHSAVLTEEERTRSLQKAVFCLADVADVPRVRASVKHAQSIMEAVTVTRDLVNQPASHMSPAVLVKEAKAIAKKSSRISLTVLNRKQAEQKKFRGFLAVARGSKEEPYVIHLKYTPIRQAQGKPKKAKKTLVIIGKGITFDSGGLSLKPAQSMENMKIDMGGAATVLGLFSVLPSLAPDIAVHGIIAACENMPSGDAYRPGDVIATMSGKTIEVLNTDAEGRITLADALTYGNTLKPDAMIDLATLTGACVVALGDTHAGLFGNNESLNTAILSAAQACGEGLVNFPLPEEYRQMVQSRVADLRNTSFMKMGGAITAALFLQEFAGKTPWAHLDIAGPVYAEQPIIPYWQFGATGYGVRTLVHVVQNFGK